MVGQFEQHGLSDDAMVDQGRLLVNLVKNVSRHTRITAFKTNTEMCLLKI